MKRKLVRTYDIFDFAAEVSIFSLFAGAVLIQLITTLYNPPSGTLSFLLFDFLLQTLHNAMNAAFGFFLFIFSFMLVLYLTLNTSFRNRTKLFISTLIGSLLIVFLIFLFWSLVGATIPLIIYIISFVTPFSFWMIYKNFWKTDPMSARGFDADILDDFNSME